LRETLTRVLRSYRFSRGEEAAGFLPFHATPGRRTDCDFDADAWDQGGAGALAAAGIGRVVLSRLPAIGASVLPLAEDTRPAWRAVIAVPADTGKTSLAALHAFGVRGIRFDLGAAGDSLDPLLRLAERIVPFGWHVELRLASPGAGRALAKAEWRLMQFPLAVCFSGIGRLGQGRRSDEADFLLGLLQLGRYWLKLSGNDLAPSQLKLWDELPPLARALQAVRKDRLIWGSGKQGDGGSATHLGSSLAALEKCLPHPGDQEQILVDNPARLYGFDQQAH
jgi:predicted TIM-barrel fold metal-dependent hydrolase